MCFCMHKCLWCRLKYRLSGPIGRGLSGKIHVENKKGGTKCDLWLVPLHYIPIVIYLLPWCHMNRPMITKPTYTTTTSPWPLHSRVHPSLLLWRLCCDLWPWPGGPNAAECQRDESAVCEGRRGGSPDLSEWRRPAREMYTLPLLLLLLYRNLSPYQLQHRADTHTPEGKRLCCGLWGFLSQMHFPNLSIDQNVLWHECVCVYI